MKQLLRLFVLTCAFLAPAAYAQPAATKYEPVSTVAISDALFKIGVLRISDPLAVDEYIRIHHCGMYEQYSVNDLAWTRIREAQGRDLISTVPTMNDNIEIEGVISLDRYDPITNLFSLKPDSQMQNTGLIKVAEYIEGSYDPCEGADYRSFVPRVHPLRLNARLSNPIDLAAIPMKQELVDRLLKSMAQRLSQNAKYEREVVLVMRLHLVGADPLSGASNASTITVTADIDELLIYEGPDRQMLLYQKDFRTPADKKKSPR